MIQQNKMSECGKAKFSLPLFASFFTRSMYVDVDKLNGLLPDITDCLTDLLSCITLLWQHIALLLLTNQRPENR